MRDYLLELRTKQNESQQDVADSISVSRQYYAMIEFGSRQKKMDITVLTNLANHFGIPPKALLEMEQAHDSA